MTYCVYFSDYIYTVSDAVCVKVFPCKQTSSGPSKKLVQHDSHRKWLCPMSKV